MRFCLAVLFAAAGLCACHAYDPLTADPLLRRRIGEPVDPASAVEVAFLGNTTLVIRDNETTLLVDGFVSRPGPGLLRCALGTIGPSKEIIKKELAATSVTRIDAVLVGHAHHDHALDATAIADLYNTEVIGSNSFANIYEGCHDPNSNSKVTPIPREGGSRTFGGFVVEFIPSVHGARDSLIQRLIGGEITSPLHLPAHISRLKCGDVFALRISHRQGEIVVTTTAGAKAGMLEGRKPSDVLFLSIGYLSKEKPKAQDFYWDQTVRATQPDVIVPVHWDDFTIPLSEGLKPATGLLGNTQAAIEAVKSRAEQRDVRILNLRESVWIADGRVYIP
jgi:L-ascorbate metabolism protein UlaG (beta-lactamase superfamily)